MSSPIRNASALDAVTITSIVRESFRDVALRFGLTLENCPKHPSNCEVRWIREALQKGIHFYILEVDDQPLGSIALEKANSEVGYIERLSVLPKHRRKGFGRSLVEHAMAQASEHGLNRIDIGIISDQIELRKWYERLGFVEQRRAVFNHLPFEVLFMSKNL